MNLDGCNANNHDFRPIDKSKWIIKKENPASLKMSKISVRPSVIGE